nr:hypothetical protein GCM10020093_110410 [Planobispora longispora]
MASEAVPATGAVAETSAARLLVFMHDLPGVEMSCAWLPEPGGQVAAATGAYFIRNFPKN